MLLRCLARKTTWPSTSKNWPQFILSSQRRFNCSRYTDKISTVSTAVKFKPTVSTMKRPHLLKQYRDIKQSYQDFVLIFQIGEAYEVYDKDADIVASKSTLPLLDTANNMESTSALLRVRFPKHQVDDVVKTLCREKVKIAICNEQTTRSTTSANLRERKVTKIFTPGTYTFAEYNSSIDTSNYLLSIVDGPEETLGLSWIDVAAQDFQFTSSTLTNLSADLGRINPSEVLISKQMQELINQCEQGYLHRSLAVKIKLIAKLFQNICITSVDVADEASTRHIKRKYAQILCAMRKVKPSQLEFEACRVLMQYLDYIDEHLLLETLKPLKFKQDEHMLIDPTTRKSLELTTTMFGAVPTVSKGTLVNVLDRTVTSAGRKILTARVTAPSTNVNEIQRRLDFVSIFATNPGCATDIHKCMQGCHNMDVLLRTISMNLGSIDTLRELMKILIISDDIKDILRNRISASDVLAVAEDLGNFIDLKEKLIRSVMNATDNGLFAKGYCAEADEIELLKANNDHQANNLRMQLSNQFGLPRLDLLTSRDFHRSFCISSPAANKISNHHGYFVIDAGTSGSSKKIEFSIPELEELNTEWLQLHRRQIELQQKLFTDLRAKIIPLVDELTVTGQTLAELDVACALGIGAHERGYCRPLITEDTTFDIKNGRHPIIDAYYSEMCVSNNCNLNEKNVWIITGPNMAGKSTFLRQNALIVIMAQMGSFVPAQSAKIGIVDRIFARVGACDNIAQHRSTFMVEMTESAYILSHATPNSFVVLDEIGRGTSTLDGISVAQAILEYFHEVIRCRTLCATHYHQLGKLATTLKSASSYQVSAKKNSDGAIMYLYKIFVSESRPGYCKQSLGIEVAMQAGMPTAIVDKASIILKKLLVTEDESFRQFSMDDLGPNSLMASGTKDSESQFATLNEDSIKIIRKICKGIHPSSINPKEAIIQLYSILDNLTPKEADGFMHTLIRLSRLAPSN
ncbi:DNA mismatch repair protein MutS [Trichoplax sp. H2]|nr:DNA mismatch repair protein MutS [Trichoplax sp. H2]|eukprot:RDD39762.1 DNA mismatch repair protein MutS [Trichoplax sp. H2]